MSKIVRLKGADSREWFQNASVVADENGVHRPLTIDERKIAKDLSRSVSAKKPKLEKMSKDGTLVTVGLETKSGKEKASKDDPFFVVGRVDGREILEGRQAMRERILREHGECQLYAPNGRLLTAIRDTSKKKPKAAELRRKGHKVDNCQCKVWKKPKGADPELHHPACQYFTKAKDVESVEERSELPEVERTDAPEPSVLPSPDACVCKAWKRAKGMPTDGHHPTCQHREAWESRGAEGGAPSSYSLANLDTGEIVRGATREEVDQALANEKLTGVLSVKVGDDFFAVVSSEDTADAQGESEESEDVIGDPEPYVDTEHVPHKIDSPDDSRELRTKKGAIKPGQIVPLFFQHQRPFKLRGLSGSCSEGIRIRSLTVGEEEQMVEGLDTPLAAFLTPDARLETRSVDLGVPLILTLENTGTDEGLYEVTLETTELV